MKPQEWTPERWAAVLGTLGALIAIRCWLKRGWHDDPTA